MKRPQLYLNVVAEVTASVTVNVSTKPMTPQKLRELLAQSKDAPEDDCLMRGS